MEYHNADDGDEQEAETEDELLASLRVSAGKFEELLRQSALRGAIGHRHLYLNILEDEVRVLGSDDGNVLLTYCTFGADFFDEINLERDIQKRITEDPNGNEFEYKVGIEMDLWVVFVIPAIDKFHESATVEIEVFGEADGRSASIIKITDTETGEDAIDGAGGNFDSYQHWLPGRFSSNEVYTNSSGKEAPTRIDTESTRIELNAQGKPDNWLRYMSRPKLRISEIKGYIDPSDDKMYHPECRTIFAVMDGMVEVQTGPGKNPMAVVQKEEEKVIRHVAGFTEPDEDAEDDVV